MTQLANVLSWTEEFAKPEVGMGATKLNYTDRDAYTIVEVMPSRKRFVMVQDVATRVDTNGMSEAQQYTFTPGEDREDARVLVTLTKKGWRVGGMRGSKVLVGVRATYYDYSF